MVRPTAGRTSVVVGLVVVLAFLGAATVPTPAAATPAADCAGSGGGAMFVADSGFTVEYNDSEPMPDDGPFRGDDGLRFRDVNLSSSGDAFVRLEDGTGPETCLAAVDATAAPIRVDPDGENAVVIEGQVDTLSLADADFGEGTVDLAYDGSSQWTLTLEATGLAQGTPVAAVDASGAEVASGTVDASGALALELPSGTRAVDLREADRGGGSGTARISVTSARTKTTEVGLDEPVEVAVELRNDGDASGDYTVTLTADGEPVAHRTVTVGANATVTVTMRTRFYSAATYSLAVEGQDAGEVTVSDTGTTEGTGAGGADQDGSDGGGPPWLLLGVVAVLLAAVGGYALVRMRGADSPPPGRGSARGARNDRAADGAQGARSRGTGRPPDERRGPRSQDREQPPDERGGPRSRGTVAPPDERRGPGDDAGDDTPAEDRGPAGRRDDGGADEHDGSGEGDRAASPQEDDADGSGSEASDGEEWDPGADGSKE